MPLNYIEIQLVKESTKNAQILTNFSMIPNLVKTDSVWFVVNLFDRRINNLHDTIKLT